MIESFVDLTYRGLPLGRRVKLAQVRPTTAYLEMPTPMPVGTTIAIATDEGVAIEATVNAIHEQTGGSDKPPGMTISPALASDATRAWWSARVALPEAEPVVAPTPRPRRPTDVKTIETPVIEAADEAAVAAVTIQPRQTQPRIAVHPPVDEAPTEMAAPLRISEEHSVPEIVDDGKKTVVMDSIDPALLEQLMSGSGGSGTRAPSGEIPQVIDTDNTKRTIQMDAVDAMALGLDAGGSGEMAAASDEDSGAVDDPDTSKPSKVGGAVVRRRKPKKR